jgi:predicted kinase
MAGLPGTGKTELSEALASRLGGIVLSKDKVRAALFPSGAITYSSDQNDFCMSVILMAAKRIAAEGHVPFVFFDGRTFSRRRHVGEVIRAATEVNADYRILQLSCPTNWLWSAFAKVRVNISPETAMQDCTGK